MKRTNSGSNMARFLVPLAGKLPQLAAFCVACTAAVVHGATNPAMRICSMAPANSSMVLIFRNPAALDRKIMQISQALKIPTSEDPLQSAEKSMGLAGMMNSKLPAGVVMLPQPQGNPAMGEPWVLALIPVNNYAAAAKALQCGTVQNGISAGTDPSGTAEYLANRGDYAIMSPSKPALKAFLADTKMLSAGLSPTYAQAIMGSDVAAYLNMKVLGPIASNGLKSIAQMMTSFEASDPTLQRGVAMDLISARAIEQFLTSATRQFIGVHISNRGISLQTIGDLRPTSPMGQLLAAQTAIGNAPLAGLPTGRYITAGAYHLNGRAIAQWLPTLTRPKQMTGPMAPIEKFVESDIQVYGNLISKQQGSNGVVFSNPGGGGISGVTIQDSLVPAATIAELEKFSARLMPATPAGTSPPFKTTFTHNALQVGGTSLTRMAMRVKASQKSMASGLKMLFGRGEFVEYLGAVGPHRIVGIFNMPKSKIPGVLAAVHGGIDTLSLRKSIQAANKHVLPHPGCTVYILVNRLLANMAANLRKENGLPQPATNGLVLGRRFIPMVASSSAQGSRLRIKLYLPMATLEDTVNQGRALVPLFMLMSEQAQ